MAPTRRWGSLAALVAFPPVTVVVVQFLRDHVLAQLEETDESFLQLVTLTDEELVAYSDDPEEATPFGQWYSEQSVEQQALAQTAALRTQTANDRFVLTREDDEADAVPLVPPEVLAVLRLKKVGTVALKRSTGAAEHDGGVRAVAVARRAE